MAPSLRLAFLLIAALGALVTWVAFHAVVTSTTNRSPTILRADNLDLDAPFLVKSKAFLEAEKTLMEEDPAQSKKSPPLKATVTKPPMQVETPKIIKTPPAFDDSDSFKDFFTAASLPKKLEKGIRSWGCNRTESPLTFVHIGKAGGGHVRARFSAGALDYNRTRGWWAVDDDEHYYPMIDPLTGEVAHGKYCSNPGHNHRIPETVLQPRSIDGTFICNASTPFGNSIACPDIRVSRKKRCQGCRDVNAQTCFTVYCFHSLMGNEMHWLPAGYLQRWWNASTWAPYAPEVSSALTKVERYNKDWCPAMNSPRPETPRELEKTFEQCNVPIAAHWDQWSDQFWKSWQGDDKIVNYGPIYATLPMQRTTVLREPFSWLVSKFFWHGMNGDKMGNKNCSDIEEASQRDYPDLGWATKFSLDYIFYLCGDDCMNRYEKRLITVEELEAQAEYNLRYSFSVVGLLERSPTFYKMVTTRVSYIDMGMNPEVMGKDHSTNKKPENLRCKEQFKDKDFQQRFLEASPEVAALARLYKVGREVNEFQYEELKKCPGSILKDDLA